MTAVAAAASDSMAWLPMAAAAAEAEAAPVVRVPAPLGMDAEAAPLARIAAVLSSDAAAAPVARIAAVGGLAAAAQMAVEDFPKRQNKHIESSRECECECGCGGLPPGCLGRERGAVVVPQRKLDGGASSLGYPDRLGHQVVQTGQGAHPLAPSAPSTGL